MKKLLVNILVLSFSSAIYSQSFYYSIKTVNSKELAGNYLYISYEAGGNKFTDSILLNGKSQIIKKKLLQPVAATLHTNNKLVAPINVFLANNQLTLNIHTNTFTVDDKSGLQPLFLQLTKNDRIRPSYFPLYGELNARNDTPGLTKLSVIFDSLRLNDSTTAKKYLDEKNNPLLSLLAFMRLASFSADYAAAESYFLQLPKWARESADGKNVTAKISAAKTVQVNTKAPLFESPGLSGEIISLKNYSGKYVLIDFWASWCGPCRKEHPALKELYTDYSNKNFNLISISLDDKKDNWVTAVAKDELPWINTSELKGFQGIAALQYGVQAIPANFLINPDGIIIAKNNSPQELKALLKKLLP